MDSTTIKIAVWRGMVGEVTPSLRMILFRNSTDISLLFVYKATCTEHDLECGSEIATQVCADVNDGIMVKEQYIKDDQVTWQEFPDYEIAFLMNENLA
jgi:hypothetical protein